jgi:hypothetical protein
MAVGLASATANSILSVLRNTAFAAIAAPVIELHIADPGAAGTTSTSAGSAARNAVTWNAPAGGSMTLATLPAWTNGGATETLSHLDIWTAAAGTFFQSGALTTPQAWVSTNTFTMTTLTLNYTPIAA